MKKIEQFNNKKRKAKIPQITSPDVVATCEVRDEYLDQSSTVVIEDCVNKKLDETHRDISEHDIETNLSTTKMVIENTQMIMMTMREKTDKTKKVKYTELFLKG